MVDAIRIAVGIDHRNDGDLQPVGLGHGDRLTLDVDHEHGARQRFHVGDAAQVVLELLQLAPQAGDFLLRKLLQGLVGLHLLQHPHARDAAADGRVVGQRAAQPARHHIGLLQALGHALDEVLRLLFGADHQHLGAAADGVIDELPRALKVLEGLMQVDDVDALVRPEDIALHLGVPALGLMSEVQACIEQVLNADVRTNFCN